MQLDTRYLAGFFDGEGSIGIYHKKNRRGSCLKTQLAQNSCPAVDTLMDLLTLRYGGCYRGSASRTGKICYGWQLSGDHAVAFLSDICSHLILKREQAEIAIMWQKQRPAPQRDKCGRVRPKREEICAFDFEVSELVRALRHTSVDALMGVQTDLRKPIHTPHRKYLAGFFDGEGSIGIYCEKKGNRGFSLKTQLVQNSSLAVDSLIDYLISRYGGSPGRGFSPNGNAKYNWRLCGDLAVTFLEDIYPHLILKKEQAEMAIAWQKQRPLTRRDKRGRFRSGWRETREFDMKVSRLLKGLKTESIDLVMEAQKDLCEPVHTLKQVLCVKG